MSRQSAPRNASHDDLHWRQRLKLENSTHDGWSASWVRALRFLLFVLEVLADRYVRSLRASWRKVLVVLTL